MDKFCETSEFSAPTGKAVTLDGDLRLLATGDGEAFERIYAAREEPFSVSRFRYLRTDRTRKTLCTTCT